MGSKDQWAELTVKKRRNWLLFLLFLIGLCLRLHGYDWGLPHHFHPDERQIVDFQAPKVQLDILNPSKSMPLLVRGQWTELNAMLDGMNTKFFAYGPLPMYTLAITVEVNDWINTRIRSFAASRDNWSPDTRQKVFDWFPQTKNPRGRITTGRFLSAIFSALTILIIFKTGKYLYNTKIGYLAAALFTFTVLSIQQAHFLVVDGPQTTLVALAMYFLVRTAMGERRRDYYLAGIFIGLAMATKFSTAPIALSYILAHILSMTLGRRRDRADWFHWIAGGVVAIAAMTIVMPFWILDSETFFRDIHAQSAMVRGVADLPYTIQFEDAMPFVYMIKNMILWSLGLPLGLAAYIGLIAAVRRIWNKPEDIGNIVILSFVIPLLYLNGTFHAQFLRYTLVTIPFFVIFAARWLHGMKSWTNRSVARIVSLTVLFGTIGWAMAFQTIYTSPHTRLQASDWVYENIPAGKHIVLESSWDDSMPVTTDKGRAGIYTSRQLGIYKEPDDQRRATAMGEILEWGDVVILSSRKHYGSVTRVPNRYPVSTNFYKLLFHEKLGYQHVKTFDNPPSLGRLRFRDDLADESFRVYEHPRVDIFVKESGLTADQIQALLMAPPPDVAAMTYKELMTRRPPTEIGPHVNYPIIRWLIALYVFGLISIPFAFIIFSKFDHKGYPFTKIIGLLVTAYLAWLLPGIQWFPFSRTLIMAVIIAVAWISHTVYRYHRSAIHKHFKERWWSIAGYEILFLTVFCIFGLLKSYNPDIYWSESSMDFGFLNAVVRAETFPPEDPWIQGQGINYYYYGQYLAGYMTKLTGVEPHYGYNLFFITIPALVALSIAAILLGLTRRVWVAATGVVFSIFIGNLDGLTQFANIWVRNSRGTDIHRYAAAFQTAVGQVFNLGRQDGHFRFFRSAHELIRPTVHEFPFWSYNFMDLHAHTVATMLTAFFLALQLVLLRNCKNGIRLFGETRIQQTATIGILWVAYGAMISTNSWDLPTQAILLLLVSIWVVVFAGRQPKYRMETAGRIPDDRKPPADESTHITGDTDSVTKTGDDSTVFRVDQQANDQTVEIVTPEPETDDRDNATVPQKTENDETIDKTVDDNAEHGRDHTTGSPEEKDEITNQPDLNGRNKPNSGPDEQETKKVYSDSKSEADTSEPDKDEKSEPVDLESERESNEPSGEFDKGGDRVDISFFERFRDGVSRFLWWLTNEVRDSVFFLWRLLWPVAMVIIGGMALHLPYLNHFYRHEMGLGTLWKYRQTTNLDGFLTMFGFFLFILITQFIRWWWDVQKDRGRTSIQALCLLVSLITVLILVWYGFLNVPEREVDYSVLLISVFLILLILSILIEGYPSLNEAFPLLLALCAVGITAGCELVFVRDFYQGGEHRRFNTIFKFYIQAWFMFAIASAYLLAVRSRIRVRFYKHNLTKYLVRTSGWVWNLVFLFLLAGTLIFTFRGVRARHHNRDFQQGWRYAGRDQTTDRPLTLDGWAYMKRDYRPVNVYRAIHWLQNNIKGTPVILEATGADYLYQFGDVSGNTGLPTVLGWWSHVDQREYLIRQGRAKGQRDRKIDTGRIRRDIETIYNSVDIPKVLSLLGQYRVQYIFVGPTEKDEYNEVGLQKFKQMSSFLTPVYTNPDVVIYRVNDYGHSVDLAETIQDNQALIRLRQEMEEREEQDRIARFEAEKERERRMMQQPARSLTAGGRGRARGMFEEPRSMTIAPDGSVYVADFRNHRVQKYDSDGKWLNMFGSSGDSPGEFNDICDLAANSTHVFVLDTFNNRIQKYTHDGQFVQLIVAQGQSVSHPRGIAVDEEYIFMADTGNSRIIRMNLSGRETRVIGRAGRGQLQFSHPVGLSIYNNEVYIVDTANQRIQVMTRDGEYLREYPVQGLEAEVYNEPYLALAEDGTIYYSDPSQGTVRMMDQQGNPAGRLTAAADGRRLSLPMGLAIDDTGNVYVVDAGNHAVMLLKRASSNQ
jgi:uncharacterized membrane protein/sugar lactone lactonase YvrE